MNRPVPSSVARRSFLSRFGAGLTTLGTALGAGTLPARAQSGDGGRWQPARHSLDDWYDQIPGKHRFVLDTTVPEAFGNALAYVNNYFTANQDAYGLQNGDLAVVLIARHLSTLFAYNDAIWAKYGVQITQRTKLSDPKTNQPPTVNLFNSTAHIGLLGNRGTTVDSLLKRGLHLAVCRLATRANAGAIAAAVGAKADAIYDELVANLLSNAHLVPAGIVAVNRAQEHGYSVASID